MLFSVFVPSYTLFFFSLIVVSEMFLFNNGELQLFFLMCVVYSLSHTIFFFYDD